jgi:hypothetical protein
VIPPKGQLVKSIETGYIQPIKGGTSDSREVAINSIIDVKQVPNGLNLSANIRYW